MEKLNKLLDEYGLSHQHPSNKLIHKIFVPLIMLSAVGLIYCLPAPEAFRQLNIDWASIALVPVMGYYLSLGLKCFLWMAPVYGAMYFLVAMAPEAFPLGGARAAVFVLSWAMQFVGHKIEGKKPSFLKDLLFLLIGPVWVGKALFAKK